MSTIPFSAGTPGGEGSPAARSRFEPFIPKLFVCFREGYSAQKLLRDIVAGLTVGIIALPLAMALAIASGVTPKQGLYTAIIAGGVISVLSGSRVLIGGPTAAFVLIVAGVVRDFGYKGLCLATLMAGVMLIIMGVARLGTMIKFIPYPLTTGFTAGIAVLIFTGQVGDFLGLSLKDAPGEFIPRWRAYFSAFNTINWWSTGIGICAVTTIILVRKFAPRIPGALVAVLLTTLLVAAFHLENKGVATIGTRFTEGIPRTLPRPAFPTLSWETLSHWQQILPKAATIAMLAAIESLLCAVVADGMIGGRHKSNCELVAQGVGNIAAIFFGGIPATGAIARTAANVKSGGRTPVAGIVHALALMAFMFLLAPYMKLIPLSALAAILFVVAWGMSEKDHFTHILKAPHSDILVLLTTFLLTILADLPTAVGVGMVLASLLFMKRMSEVTNVGAISDELQESIDESNESADPQTLDRRIIPTGVEVYEINGPFFFGVADRLKDTLQGLEKPPKIFILRMRRVPAIDASGLHALKEFYDKCKRQHTLLLLAGVHAQPIFAMTNYGLIDTFGVENMLENIDDALDRARELLGQPPQPKPVITIAEVARERTKLPPS